jgi:hypothetical protein
MSDICKKKDEEFIALYRKLGSPTLVAKELGLNPRSIANRRASLEIRYGIKLESHGSLRDKKKEKPKKKACDELAPGESADNKEKTVAHTLPRVFGRDIA